LCTPGRGQEKGSVENLVGFVKGSFFKVRRFHDHEDLVVQLGDWHHEVNEVRPCRATKVTPATRIAADRARLRPLAIAPEDYALRFPVMVGPTGVVTFEGYRYSMPPEAIGIPGTLWLYRERVRIVAGGPAAFAGHGRRAAAVRRAPCARAVAAGGAVMAPLDLDGMLRRLHLPTVRRLYPELETRIERSVRKARFPFLRTIEDFDFTF